MCFTRYNKENNDFMIISESMIAEMKSKYVTDVIGAHLKAIKSYLGTRFFKQDASILKDKYETLECFNWYQGFPVYKIIAMNTDNIMVPLCDFSRYAENKSIDKITKLWSFLEDYIEAGGAVRYDGYRITNIDELRNHLESVRDKKNKKSINN